jgi:hypothetical protein
LLEARARPILKCHTFFAAGDRDDLRERQSLAVKFQHHYKVKGKR